MFAIIQCINIRRFINRGMAIKGRNSLFSAVVLAGLLLTLLSSCAYRAGLGERQIPGGYQLIAVPMFKNSTDESGAEVYFTDAMIRELERSRIARVVDRSAAQVTLEGNIDSIAFLATNQVLQGAVGAPTEMPKGTVLNTEYRILLKTTIRLRRNSDQQIVWQGSFTGERSYLAPKITINVLNSSNAPYNHSARYQNFQLMAADLMSEAHDRMTENFW
jgi:hypothetical protein